MLQHEAVGGKEVMRTSAGREILSHLDEKTFEIQTELMRRMLNKNSIEEISNDEGLNWITMYSEQFRIHINGHKGAYNLEKDTEGAQRMRALYHSDPNEFYTEMKKVLVGRQLH